VCRGDRAGATFIRSLETRAPVLRTVIDEEVLKRGFGQSIITPQYFFFLVLGGGGKWGQTRLNMGIVPRWHFKNAWRWRWLLCKTRQKFSSRGSVISRAPWDGRTWAHGSDLVLGYKLNFEKHVSDLKTVFLQGRTM